MPHEQHVSTSVRRLDPAQVRERASGDPELQALVDVVVGRAAQWTANATLVVPGELGEWWHVCWERLEDVAFAEALVPDPDRATWLRSETLRLCGLPADDWVGPFFRQRMTPQVGQLETAHVGLAVASALELCPHLFDADERSAIEHALVTKCLQPCERALVAREVGLDIVTGEGPERHQPGMQNWYWVLLDAFGAIALLTGDRERIASLPSRFNLGAGLHNADSYGESVQYWGYAAIHLTNLWELIDRFAPELLPELDRVHEAMMPWLAHAVMFTGQTREWGPGSYTTMVNVGDSAFTARPPADALTSIARYAAEPTSAGLARWLYDTTYADPVLAPTDLASFGFFNQVGWRTIVNLLQASTPIGPEQAGLPTAQRFETGSAVVRDRWDDPRTVLAAQTGHDRLNVDSHRHEDHGSFVLGFGGEVFFTDPGHCCYRLQAFRDAVSVDTHSTWILRDGTTGEPLPRSRTLGAAVGRRRGPVTVGGRVELGVDLADLYPATVRRAERTWITALPHIVLVVDEIEADTPVVVDTRFVLNNRDNLLRVNHATDNRMVLRRGQAAAKFFRLEATAGEHPVVAPPRRSWTAAHDIYHPQPNAPTQGKEGSAVVHTFEVGRPATTYRAVYAIVMAPEPQIRGWHIDLVEGKVRVTDPDGEPTLLDPAPSDDEGLASHD